VPDNQEVFAHSKSDQSFIFDILEYAEGMSDEQAVEYHFKDLVGESGDSKPTIKNIQRLDLNLPK
jgi:hypothetical protein